MTNDEIAAVANYLVNSINELKNKPAVDQMQADWDAGREFARSKGYRGEELDELENYMQDRSILHHEDAVRLAPFKPSRNFVFGAEDDEMQMLMNGDFDRATNLALGRLKRGK